MSNHSGSYLLGETLDLMDAHGLVDSMSLDVRRQFMSRLLRIAGGYDCNNGEILGEYTQCAPKFGTCYYCRKSADPEDLGEDCICPDCRR